MTMGTSARTCPECASPVATTDNFCEHCGRELSVSEISVGSTAAAACLNCGSSAMPADGFCEQCGHKAPSGRDHVEIDLGALAGVTDRGRRHGRNEDAMALAVTQTPRGSAALAVVCDGVSTSHRPDDASIAAAETALRVLTAEMRTGIPAADALTSATAAAQKAVSELVAGSEDAPATTIVCACVAPDSVAVCWVGDSRAYWLPADHSDARLLTRDDSLGEALVAAGALTATEAVESPEGHVLTRWLGADAEPAEPPHTTSFEPSGPGVLLLCSDGLWNYEPSAAGLAALIPAAALKNLATAAAALVEFALDRGGEDNITAVLASFPPL
jgi:serine/threonine protein phosphatase PrpC